jgi:hypothetical protein
MAFTPIENQPVIFNPVVPCYVEQDGYTYSMDLTDETQVAFALTPCEDAVSSEFTTIEVTEGWTFDDQIYTSDGTSGATLTITNDVAWNTQTLWEFKISIETYVAGVLIIQVPGWGDYSIMGNGVYTFYVSSASALSTYTIISDPFIGTILLENGLNQNPVIRPVNVNNLVHLINSETDAIVDTLTPTIYNNIAVYTFDWNTYPAACYKIGYIDGCTNFAGRFNGICNGLPTTNLNCWTSNGSGSWTFDDAFFFEQEAGSGQGRLSNGTLLEAGFTYQITFELVSMTSATTYRMTWLSEDEVTTQIGPLLSTGDIGVHTFSYTPIVDGYLQLQFSASSPSSEGKIKDVIVELTGPFEYDGLTPCLCTDSATTCSIEFGGCFADTFIMAGVELDNRFQPTLRLGKDTGGDPVVKLFKKQYLADFTKYRTSLGKNQINFFDVQNSYILRIERQPEFIFDFLFKMWIGFDNMLINGQAFRINDDQIPVIEWSDKTALGSVDLVVIPFQEKTRKVLCGFRNQPCAPITPTDEVGMLYEDLDGMLFQNENGRLYNL